MLPYIVARSRSAFLVALAVAAAPAAACRRDETPRPDPTEREAVGRGDRVVVEARAAVFFEGRVLSVDKDRLRVEVPASEPLVVARADVYRLPAPTPRGLAPGRLGVCRFEAGWAACRVERQEGGRFHVEAADGGRAVLAADALVAPSPLTELNLKQRFARAAGRSEFLTGAASAGRPTAPPEFRLLPRARVVARRRDGWFSGVIHEIDDDDAYVEFKADGLRERVPGADIVPEPPASAPPARGDFVLVRPESPSQPWKTVRVLGTSDDQFKVIDENAEESVVPLRDVLVLGARG